jgi:hypothetical protein
MVDHSKTNPPLNATCWMLDGDQTSEKARSGSNGGGEGYHHCSAVRPSWLAQRKGRRV